MRSIKNFKTAPLPFQGQKRMWIAKFKEVLNDYNDSFIFIDLFGGSGLLSHTTKQHYTKARVVYNDYDNYFERINNVAKTNALLADLRRIVADLPRDRKIEGEYRERIIDCLIKETGFVDWITISSSLLFSMNYSLNLESLIKESFYNSVRKNDYDADGYLDGVEIVRLDYKELFNQFKDIEKVVFIVDPPYLSTDAGSYKNYWKLKDYLDVLNVLKDTNYIYFTSDKSSILELTEWLAENLNATDPFKGARKETFRTQSNAMSKYLDIMLSKKRVCK